MWSETQGQWLDTKDEPTQFRPDWTSCGVWPETSLIPRFKLSLLTLHKLTDSKLNVCVKPVSSMSRLWCPEASRTCTYFRDDLSSCDATRSCDLTKLSPGDFTVSAADFKPEWIKHDFCLVSFCGFIRVRKSHKAGAGVGFTTRPHKSHLLHTVCELICASCCGSYYNVRMAIRNLLLEYMWLFHSGVQQSVFPFSILNFSI